MNRSVKITLLVVAVLLLLLFALLGPEKGRFDWREYYRSDKDSPYGTLVLKKMLEGQFGDRGFKAVEKGLSEQLPAEGGLDANYVFVGQAMFLDSTDTRQLLDFVSAGNTAFICARSLPYDLMFHVYFHECEGAPPWDDLSPVADTAAWLDLPDGGKHKFNFVSNHETQMRQWRYLDTAFFCNRELGFEELQRARYSIDSVRMNEARIVFARAKYRNYEKPDDPGGYFYFHTIPLAFTNYHLLQAGAKAHADQVFSHLGEGAVYWDQYAQTSEAFSRQTNSRRRNPNMTLSSESPLKYILGDRHLAGAWYSLLGLGVLYLMFRAKRRQRIMPVIQGNTNSSLAFVKTIGAMYYNRQSHRKICQQKMNIFLADIRRRYQLSTAHINPAFLRQLSARSGLAYERLEKFFLFYENIIKSHYVGDDTLLDYHKEMQAISEVMENGKLVGNPGKQPE